MRKRRDESPDNDTRVTITSHNQSGGVTAHTVNVSSPRPDVNLTVAEHTVHDSGRASITVRVDLIQRQAMAALIAEAKGRSLVRMELVPIEPGLMQTGPQTLGPTRASVKVLPPLCQAYDMFITTDGDEQIEVEVRPE